MAVNAVVSATPTGPNLSPAAAPNLRIEAFVTVSHLALNPTI